MNSHIDGMIFFFFQSGSTPCLVFASEADSELEKVGVSLHQRDSVVPITVGRSERTDGIEVVFRYKLLTGHKYKQNWQVVVARFLGIAFTCCCS